MSDEVLKRKLYTMKLVHMVLVTGKEFKDSGQTVGITGLWAQIIKIKEFGSLQATTLNNVVEALCLGSDKQPPVLQRLSVGSYRITGAGERVLKAIELVGKE